MKPFFFFSLSLKLKSVWQIFFLKNAKAGMIIFFMSCPFFFNSTNMCFYLVSALSNTSVNQPEHYLYTSGEKDANKINDSIS